MNIFAFVHGFRPGRSPHNALDAIYVAITQRKVNYVPRRGYSQVFDTLVYEWLMKFVEDCVGDSRVLRPIR